MPIPSEPTPPFKPVPAVSAACFSTECFGRCYLFMVSRELFPGTATLRKGVERAGSGSFERVVFYGKRMWFQPTKSCSGSGNGPDAAEQDDHNGSQECSSIRLAKSTRLAKPGVVDEHQIPSGYLAEWPLVQLRFQLNCCTPPSTNLKAVDSRQHFVDGESAMFVGSPVPRGSAR